MSNCLKVMKVKKNAILPKRATVGSAGMDLFACIDKPILIYPSEQVTIPTGIAISIEDINLAGMIFARSGLAVKHGITLSNGVGVIDSDYRGEVLVGLCNISKEPYEIKPMERIAQLVLMPVAIKEIIEVDSLSETTRNLGGFGSTGKY